MENELKRVLVLGASGMLGNAVMRVFSKENAFCVFGATRSTSLKQYVSAEIGGKLIFGHEVERQDHLIDLFQQSRPDIVINCVGLVKQLNAANDPLQAIPINSILPHRLAKLCGLISARLVHMSTDCVFSGHQGGYTEMDHPDAEDLYGRSKLMGEVDYKNSITLRTSIIGHELNGSRSLVNWFLSQENRTKGYTRAIFSGLPTVKMAEIIRDHVIPHPELHGLYHVSADPINKYDLLSLVAKEYGKAIEIEPDESVCIDRSLDSSRFRQATGFDPAPWPVMISQMHEFR